ncbi:hypothetical protein I7I53_01594 [Histoplasma capsulatum var. duboisii H88]|uniref:Uncharacterized protein n=1 Tax=Ajellomyces capsulatus (strain H88) TaxID=544711 RepID=A0A8A1LIB7_AJEC8|nr:hypothetical protein I7I53_01594 [Histoplasma capsulatum var. duboisii H88]
MLSLTSSDEIFSLMLWNMTLSLSTALEKSFLTSKAVKCRNGVKETEKKKRMEAATLLRNAYPPQSNQHHR